MPMLALATLQASAQLNVSTVMSPQQLVEDVLLGSGVVATNITYTGDASSRGSFTTGTTNLGLAAGVVLSTGDVLTIPGSGSSAVGGGLQGGSDPDLVQLSGQTINSAAILEFDFVPTGDSLKFNFVFASEEYPDYVCSQYNDAFGFFLSGPGLNGPFTNNAVNVAVVPSTTVPITINTINSGTPGAFYSASTCAAADPNWQNNSVYYVNNQNGTTVAFNGFTVVLTALAQVQCGETYHIKLAIGNGSDFSLQSGVFLQAGSFQSNVLPQITAETLFGDGTAAEGCDGARFTIFRPANISDSLAVHYFMTGTATEGVDYDMPPSPAVIPAGEDSVVLYISAFEDGISEGIETAIMNVFLVNACGDTISNSAMFAIIDYPPIQIHTEPYLLLNCDKDSIPLYAYTSGGFGQTTLAWGDSLYQNEVYVPGMENGSYTLSATDECPKTVEMTVMVDAGCLVVIPNVMTPNSDGQNDFFVIEGIAGRDNFVQIWDRWGKEVFSAANYQNNFSARGLHDGTYFYLIRILDQEYTGNLHILGSK